MEGRWIGLPGRRTGTGLPGSHSAGLPPGFSLPEVLLALALLAILVLAATPILSATVARERLLAAGREMAGRMRELRQRAVAQRCSFGIRFVRTGETWSYSIHRDGDGDGIRSADIAAGRDPLVAGPADPADLHEGIRAGLPAFPVPRIPPDSGAIPNPEDPVKFGSGDLISFSPGGTASSGTLYLTDGRRVLALVLYGGSGRVRVWRYDPERGGWSDS